MYEDDFYDINDQLNSYNWQWNDENKAEGNWRWMIEINLKFSEELVAVNSRPQGVPLPYQKHEIVIKIYRIEGTEW